VDFGDILNKWEKQKVRLEKGSSPANEGWPDHIQKYDGDAVLEKEEGAGSARGASSRGERRSRLLRKKPDDCIDLHGLKADEAWSSLETFFENSRNKGCEKLLIIHGKGNHRARPQTNAQSDGALYEGLNAGALRDLSRRFIELCPFAGESGYSTAREGGTGATWVFLKERK